MIFLSLKSAYEFIADNVFYSVVNLFCMMAWGDSCSVELRYIVTAKKRCLLETVYWNPRFNPVQLLSRESGQGSTCIDGVRVR